jgi:hypothetical protein
MEAVIFFFKRRWTSTELHGITVKKIIYTVHITATRASNQTKSYTQVRKHFLFVVPPQIPVAPSSQNILEAFSVMSHKPAFFLEQFT